MPVSISLMAKSAYPQDSIPASSIYTSIAISIDYACSIPAGAKTRQ